MKGQDEAALKWKRKIHMLACYVVVLLLCYFVLTKQHALLLAGTYVALAVLLSVPNGHVNSLQEICGGGDGEGLQLQ
jgi:hypothetical protein